MNFDFIEKYKIYYIPFLAMAIYFQLKNMVDVLKLDSAAGGRKNGTQSCATVVCVWVREI